MPRARRGAARRRAKKRLLKRAKGFFGGRSRLYRTAHDTLTRAGVYAFRDRRVRKRDFRRLWITRVSAGARALGVSYSRLIKGLKRANVAVNTKMLADLAVSDEKAFAQLVQRALENLRDELGVERKNSSRQ